MTQTLTSATPATDTTTRRSRYKFKDLAPVIIAEAGCDDLTARRVVAMCERARHEHYHHGDMYHLSDNDIARCHDVLELIMPDDVKVPRPGSAHDLLNQVLLPDPFSIGFVHLKDGPRAEYCGVVIEVMESVVV